MRAIVAALLGGAAFLLFEVRFEHGAVLHEDPRSWIPLATATLLLVVGVPAFLWRKRAVLAALFGLAVIVGVTGVLFHTDGHVLHALAKRDKNEPPPLAPLAFSGLGAIGLLALRERD